MTRRAPARYALLVVALGLAPAGCAGKLTQVEHTSFEAGNPNAMYNAAIFDASVFRAKDSLPLKTIPEGTTTVTGVTWTNWDGYKVGSNTLTQEVWITLVPEVQDLCRGFPQDPASLTLRLQQLLGVPTSSSYTQFVVMEIPRSAIFRPCANPDPALGSCDEKMPPASPEQQAHQSWLAGQAWSSWQVPGGYPWTRLGYTYNWLYAGSADPQNKYGASEFVVRPGSTVNVTQIVPTAQYCAPAAAPATPTASK